MPEVFKFGGYSYFYYSREHEPIHIHVEGNGSYAKFDLVNEEFVLKEKHGIKTGDLKRIHDIITENKDIIKNHWNNFFKTLGK